ncbi:MAG: hypothetical protein ACOYNC_10340 [Bacteroidales bacterium]
MKKSNLRLLCIIMGILWLTSCRHDKVAQIAETRLVLFQEIQFQKTKIDGRFRALLELLYPHECHDTIFIQNRVFLERVDLAVPFSKEFRSSSGVMMDFFSVNSPEAKQAERRQLLFTSTNSLENRPWPQLLADSPLDIGDQDNVVRDFLRKTDTTAMIYLASFDPTRTVFAAHGITREVHHDLSKLNCRIVEDLRKRSQEKLKNATVIILLIPPGIQAGATDQLMIERTAPNRVPVSKEAAGKDRGGGSECPPDSVVEMINKRHNEVIREFRNLLYYIATTNKDEALRKSFREAALREISKIPELTVEGIEDMDLHGFLNSSFRRNVAVVPISDHCNRITGIRIIAP